MLDYFRENFFVIPIFLVMITLLVAAHEYGHYLFARIFKMDIEEFAIGFGKKPLFTWLRKKGGAGVPVRPTNGAEAPTGVLGTGDVAPPGDHVHSYSEEAEGEKEDTVFTVRPWPLGGFVRIKGMLPADDGSEVRIKNGFYSKPPLQRFMVLLAGPLFSLLAGVLVLIPFFWSKGVEEPNREPVIYALGKDGPAHIAGLEPGDRIVQIDGQPVDDWYQVLSMIRERPRQFVPLEYERDGERFVTTVVPVLDHAPMPVVGPDLRPTLERKMQGKIWAEWGYERVPLTFGEATLRAFKTPGEVIGLLASYVTRPALLKEAVGGPVTMVRLTKQTSEMGFMYVVFLAGMLSISLGIFNLLPFPPLDGGQMLIALLEMLRRGRRLSIQVQSALAGAGLVFVGLLILTVLVIDIGRLMPDPAQQNQPVVERIGPEQE
jgi:regulator of sigma E protease